MTHINLILVYHLKYLLIITFMFLTIRSRQTNDLR
jgi:hypothetical protein